MITDNSRENLPKLIYNNFEEKRKVLSDIQTNIENCENFDFSVAFIADSGIACLKQTFLNYSDSKRKGRIITSTYLGFNSPKAYRELLKSFKNSNVEIRIYNKDGFHPKGYIFNYKQYTKIIIGSSNLTQSALCTNQEWNISISSFLNKEVVDRVKEEFEEQWSCSTLLNEEWIEEYEKTYIPIERKAAENKVTIAVPNKMQEEALDSLQRMREEGKDRALLISATGTGKTYLSAFDVKKEKPKKMLFVVHRGTIAAKAMDTFKNIIHDKKIGMLSSWSKQDGADYVFAVINTISKDEYLYKYQRNEFDYIIIDEVHKAGAEMYSKLLNYFKPKFLLGMSATPERTDNPEKIYELFNYNIAYEIRLKQAMKYDLLCPFHYYGVSDIKINGKEIDSYTSFNDLIHEERVKNVLSAIETYGYSGTKPHGLIFVSRIEEAEYYSTSFNDAGYKTVALSGKNSDIEKEKCIKLLEEEDTNKDHLDYIFTVDIFNEGVDIPCVNQIVMLRSTKSAIVFVQQLGRGLRKNNEKEYVNVIDIIGNYDNNYMIPIAISDSYNYNKDDLRRTITNGSRELPGCSTISFDQISQRKIYSSIDSARLNTIKIIKESYFNLKIKVGKKIPSLLDFDRFSSIDPIKIFDYCGSYYHFLKKYESDYKIDFSKDAFKENALEYISCSFGAGKRIQELEFLYQIVTFRCNVLEATKIALLEKYNYHYSDKSTDTIISEMTGNYAVGANKEKFKDVVLIKKCNNDYSISEEFEKALSDKEFEKSIMELVEFAIHRYRENYSNNYKDTDFVLYKKYTYSDVYRLLNWKKPSVDLNVGGYFFDKSTNTFPVFVNYDKTNAKESIQYGDYFEDERHFVAISKHPRTISSSDAEIIEKARENNTDIHLFVRKNSKAEEAKEFYYLGKVSKYKNFVQTKTKAGDDAFEIPYVLDTSVREDVYSYLIS